MAVSEGDLAFALDQLAGLGELRSRRMFGGVGLYCGDRFFALMDDGVLYLKADDETRGRYTKRRLKPFQPPGSPPSTNYYTVPASVLEDADELLVWARDAVEAAERAAAKKGPARKAPAAKTRTARR
jgi:DNA transformation protein